MSERIERVKDYFSGCERREEALKHVKLDNLGILEFGVFSGASIAYIHNYLNKTVGYSKIWGFDSFEGLPKEYIGVTYHPDWKPGSFNAKEWFGIDSQDDIITRLYLDFINFGILPGKVELIKGWFADSLTDDLAKKIGKVSYIGVDCDLYISSYQALDWVFRNNLYTVGTVIYYDDWQDGQVIGSGEWLAHKELAQKYNIKFQTLYESGTAAFMIYG